MTKKVVTNKEYFGLAKLAAILNLQSQKSFDIRKKTIS